MSSNSGALVEGIEEMEEVVKVGAFHDFLVKLLALVLEDGENSPSSSLLKMMGKQNSVDVMKKFLGDPQSKSLMIEQLNPKG